MSEDFYDCVMKLFPNARRASPNTINLGELNEDAFERFLKNQVYRGCGSSLPARYAAAYKWFQKQVRSGTKIVGVSYEDPKKADPTENTLKHLEYDLAYSVFLGVNNLSATLQGP